MLFIPMTLGPQNADDSCLVNQTVPAGFSAQPVHLGNKSYNADAEAGPVPPSIRNATEDDDSETDIDATFPEGGLERWCGLGRGIA